MAISTSDFIDRYAPYAMEQQIKYGIPSSVTLAQMALESTWGTSKLAREDNNFFGIKKGSSWVGGVGYHDDDRPNEPFRRYDSAEQSIENHSYVLLQPRYQRRCPVNDSTNHLGWIQGIKAGGYATDANYVSKVEDIIRTYALDKFDLLALQQAEQKGLQIGYMRGSLSDYTRPSSSQILLTPLQGHWCMPINLEGLKVTGVFGESRPGHHHGGIDFSTNGKYLPIYGTEDNGKVIAVKPNNGAAGNMLTVEYNRSDGTRIQCTYMHLSEIGVKVGDSVNAGMQLGYSGNSGRSTGAHLHFETKFYNANGELLRYDPAEYIAELSFRGNLPSSLDKNGQNLIARYSAQMAYNNLSANMQEPQMDARTQMLLAQLTNSDDPNRWLEYLMNKNGDSAGMSHGGNPISNLISTLFMSILTLAQELKQEGDAMSESQNHREVNETKEATSLRRDRDSVNVKRLAQTASLNFDNEFPEEQQTNTLRRT
uniref:Glucosaminidase domain-containing protein n=1 Tax=Prevotella sp. GTC17254 TaxID=3236794 RepID=A0AB33J3S1_9BACT